METTTILTSFPSSKIEKFEQGILKINKLFTKKKLGEVTFNVISTFNVTKKVQIDNIVFDNSFIDVKVEYSNIEVHIPIPVYKLNGYKYIASISGRQGSTAIYSNDSSNKVFENYDTSLEFNCNHCGSKRYRVFKAIFEKENSQEVFYIGSSCAKEYFGIDFLGQVEKIINICKYFENDSAKYGEETENRCRFYNSVAETINISTYLFNDQKKYVSKKTAEIYLQTSSSENVSIIKSELNNLYSKERANFLKYVKENVETLKQDFEKVISYWKNVNPSNDFEFNLKNAILQENCDRVGLIVYGTWVVLKDRWIKKEVSENVQYNNEAIGNPKDKKASNVELIFTTTYQNQFGQGRLYKFVTDDNYLLTYFTNTNYDFEAGWKGSIQYSIKGKNDYKGQVSTIITRVKEIA